ncbi:hypothetical protein HPB47_020182 [Ixodes persulcatus]|uniref:Uncharacterized protein n=1 Tax=Ixodes persulcatus TaxID=34615 RepID=A0AC60QI42_IXOPE|nr:hypothetical protein HPB47_020182 [Ixodes persulcatus]
MLRAIVTNSVQKARHVTLQMDATKKRESYSLPDGSEFVVGMLKSSFRCHGSGYFADVDNNCQVFHVCHEMPKFMGPPRYQLYSFMCGNMTMFDQLTLTCTYPDDAVPCASAPDFYAVNDNIGNEDALFLTDEEMGKAERFYEEDNQAYAVSKEATRNVQPKDKLTKELKPATRTERPPPVTQATTTTPPSTTTKSYHRYTTVKYQRPKQVRKQSKQGGTEGESTAFIAGNKAKKGSRRKQPKVEDRSEQVSGDPSAGGEQAKPIVAPQGGAFKKTVIRSMSRYKGAHKEVPGHRKKVASSFREQAPDTLLKTLEAAFAQDYPQVTETSYQRIPRKKIVVVPRKKASLKSVKERTDRPLTPTKFQASKDAQKTNLNGLVVLTKDFIQSAPKEAVPVPVVSELQVAEPAAKSSSDGVEKEVPEELMKEIEKALNKQLEGALASGERQATFSKALLMKEIEESLKKELETGNLKKESQPGDDPAREPVQPVAKHEDQAEVKGASKTI